MVKIKGPQTNTILGFGVQNEPTAINNTLKFDSSAQQFVFEPEIGGIHAQISDNTTQAPADLNPTEITMDTDDDLQGITHPTPADIVVSSAGTYLIIAAPQTVRTSGSMPRTIDFWFRVNDVDVPNSNVRISSDKNSDTDVVVTQQNLDLAALDKINIIMEISATGEGLGIAAINPAGEPRIPAIIVSIVKIS